MFSLCSTEITVYVILHVICFSLQKLKSTAICISVCAFVTLAYTAVQHTTEVT